MQCKTRPRGGRCTLLTRRPAAGRTTGRPGGGRGCRRRRQMSRPTHADPTFSQMARAPSGGE
eukprot:7384536-Lingulodinium_polyedra.AAC.1